MTRRGPEINKQVIARMMRDMQKESDGHPIRVPVQLSLPELPDISHSATITYNARSSTAALTALSLPGITVP